MPALVRGFSGVTPRLGERVYLSETCVVLGDVVLGDDVNVWFGAVLRGDVGYIRVGARTNIQDLSMLHMSRSISNTEIGEDCTIGHNVIVHGATIGSGALIGMGAILLDNAVVGEGALIGAGALLRSGFVVPPRTLVVGNPARVVRELDAEESKQGSVLAARYLELSRAHSAS
jgi:carbonic anhydrase/acetyltransferase-like protein (isoleucine patch superfamily)